jgi:DNA-binding beta-propeller fold protein YncE
MKRSVKKIAVLLLLVCILVTLFDHKEVKAETPYKTYTVDGYGYLTETQTAYMPYDSITKIGDLSLDAPRDLAIQEDGTLYIADTGNLRIIKSNIKGELLSVLEYEEFRYPCGLFVTEDGTLYVADRDANAVFVFDANNQLIHKYTKPDHPLYGEAMEFKPMKLVVNQAGIMFIICEANTNGVVQISPTEENGSFLGYYGTNFTSASLQQVLLRMFATDAQRAKMVSNIPSTPDNLAIDKKGLLYTVTRGEEYNTLKKLNIAGKNLIEADTYDEYPAAVATGNYENIFMVSSLGYVFEFNGDGEVLFIFGGSDDGRQRIGLCKKVEAIGVDNQDRLYLLDSDMNQIHIFATTEFTDLVHNALYLYSKGRYEESQGPLNQILTMNSMFDYANKAMGRAYLQQEDYEAALKYAKLAKDYTNYSDAMWEIRNIWIQDNIVTAVGVILAFILAVKGLKLLHKKKGIFHGVNRRLVTFNKKKLVSQLRYSTYFMKHPIDGCYGVKREEKASFLCANILFVGFIALYIINKYFCGFLFKEVREGWFTLGSDITYILGIFILMTISNYLICAINEGEGSFKQIYCSFIYCLTPYLVIKPFIILISQVITNNEVFIIRFADTFMMAWIVILVLISLKEINNYKIKEVAKVVGLTFFAALIAVLVLFILYVLWSQVFDFIVSIGGEVVYRLGL